jgi:DnaJ-class molecular chaperone
MATKYELANYIVDELDNCAGGEPCNAVQVQTAFIRGFDTAKELMLKSLESHQASQQFISGLRALGEESQCPECDGRGFYSHPFGPVDCEECAGSGQAKKGN